MTERGELCLHIARSWVSGIIVSGNRNSNCVNSSVGHCSLGAGLLW